ncbi:MAG: glycosyltransferase family 2 protein [Candidatus Omnitrophica bacterium]|nr:glycosyltransferase family 2 protein [Candidatus Omnitrophota bacterium]
MSEEKISILIAAYNEEGNIGRAIESIRKVLPSAEIIVVDDGSLDRTLYKARQYENELVKVFSLPHRGKGSAIRKAIDEASGRIMVQIDADLQFYPSQIPELIKPILDDKASIVFASRYLKMSKIEKGSVSKIKYMASFLMARIISLVIRQSCTDIFAGFKAFRSEAIRDIDIREKDFAYEAEIAVKAKRRAYSFMEMPCAYRRRLSGASKIQVFYHTVVILPKVIRLLFFSR